MYVYLGPNLIEMAMAMVEHWLFSWLGINLAPLRSADKHFLASTSSCLKVWPQILTNGNISATHNELFFFSAK